MKPVKWAMATPQSIETTKLHIPGGIISRVPSIPTSARSGTGSGNQPISKMLVSACQMAMSATSKDPSMRLLSSAARKIDT